MNFVSSEILSAVPIVDRDVLIHGGSLEWSETIRKFQIHEGAMAGSHVEEGGEQVRGKDSGPST